MMKIAIFAKTRKAEMGCTVDYIKWCNFIMNVKYKASKLWTYQFRPLIAIFIDFHYTHDQDACSIVSMWMIVSVKLFSFEFVCTSNLCQSMYLTFVALSKRSVHDIANNTGTSSPSSLFIGCFPLKLWGKIQRMLPLLKSTRQNQRVSDDMMFFAFYHWMIGTISSAWFPQGHKLFLKFAYRRVIILVPRICI